MTQRIGTDISSSLSQIHDASRGKANVNFDVELSRDVMTEVLNNLTGGDVLDLLRHRREVILA